MNTKQNITLDINNPMVTKLSNIQEKFNNRWESNHNPEKIRERKLKRERKNNKKK